MAEQTQTKAMPLDRDTESGRYTQSYTADMVLNVLESRDGASTSEVADEIGSSRRLALRRLRELEDDGRVSAREIGNTYLWMVSDEEEADQ
jgi:predicted ArsR family transcriptional regulator